MWLSLKTSCYQYYSLIQTKITIYFPLCEVFAPPQVCVVSKDDPRRLNQAGVWWLPEQSWTACVCHVISSRHRMVSRTFICQWLILNICGFYQYCPSTIMFRLHRFKPHQKNFVDTLQIFYTARVLQLLNRIACWLLDNQVQNLIVNGGLVSWLWGSAYTSINPSLI